jgi:hypothetical protein
MINRMLPTRNQQNWGIAYIKNPSLQKKVFQRCGFGLKITNGETTSVKNVSGGGSRIKIPYFSFHDQRLY